MRTTGLLIGLLLCCACGKLSTLRKNPTSVNVIESAWKSARYQEPRAEARRAVAKSDFVAAEAAFKRGLSLAEANQDWAVAARFNVNIANTQLVRGLRAGVADALQHATAVATRHHDNATVSAAAITLANLHLAQNNWSAAEEQARDVLNSGTPINPKLRLALLASLSRSVGELRGPSAAMPTLQLCIEQAQAADADALLAKAKGSLSPAPIASTNQSLEAEFWDLAGHLYLLSKDWNRAEQALRRSYRLRLMAKDSRITWLYERFTRLAIGRRKWDEAARWLALANHSQRSLNSGVDWVLSVLDGQIAEGKGDTTHALRSYRTAWQQAKTWRRGAAAQEDALVNTEVQVQQAAEGFLRLAGRQLQLAKPQPGNRLVLEAFTIAEESRAWSMMLQAKGELSEPTAPSPGEAVILFALGNEISHRWDWTANGLVWTPLPPRSVLQPLIKQTAQEIQEGLPGNAANTLHKLLLANAPRESHWRLVPDQELFTMPFSALRNDQGQYLVESHDLAMVPSLRLARKPGTSHQLSYLGAGDLIFNRADERWQTSVPSSGPALVHAAESNSQELIRLAGSGAEVRALQRIYDKANVPALTLEGSTASRARLESAIDARQPAVLHLATHATAVDSGRSIGLSLGLSRTGEMEYWTANRVASLKHVPSLVMLNACASGRAQALPGAGLLGMSRAWLMAGAQDVILSSWALPDDNGEFARLFHQEFLARYGEPNAVASALRAAQITCLRSPGFRAAPRFWAAYFLTSTHSRTKTITRQ